MDTLRWSWGFLLLALLVAGCAPPDISQPAPMPSCTPEAEAANPYDQATDGVAGLIYSYSQLAGPGAEARRTAEYEGFLLLVDQVRTWSDYVDILVEGDRIVRITVTFISPKLVESVILTQILDAGISVADFAKTVEAGQNNIAQRDELMFLITITASQYQDRLLPNDSLLLQLPINEMTLTNAEGLSVSPRHRDDHLVNQINLHSGPEHGYLAYPIAVENNLACHWMVDPLWTTAISLHVPHLYINNVDYGLQTWSMDYRSLIEMDRPANMPVFVSPPPGSDLKWEPRIDAPLAVNGIPRSDTAYWDGYWEDMSRFVWYHLTDTTHH